MGEQSVFMKRTVEKGVSEYKEIVDELEGFFFDLEKMKPIDLSDIYIILPSNSRMKKKCILWGFSIANKCKSKVYIAVKKTEKMKKEIEKLSKAMGVEFEFLEGDIDRITEKVKKERNLVILPRDVIEFMKKEAQKGPLMII